MSLSPHNNEPLFSSPVVVREILALLLLLLLLLFVSVVVLLLMLLLLLLMLMLKSHRPGIDGHGSHGVEPLQLVRGLVRQGVMSELEVKLIEW